MDAASHKGRNMGWQGLRQWAAAGVLGVMLAGCQAGPHQCKLITSGDMPILNSAGSPIVRAVINGHPVALIVDSGAQDSVIGKSYAETLGLENSGAGLVTHGVGGSDYGQVEIIRTLDLGSSKAKNVGVVVTGVFDGSVAHLPVVGLFGRDFLGNYDMLVDMPRHRVRLVDVEDCSTPTPSWAGRIHTVRVGHPYGDNHRTTLDIRLNGHPAEASLDTGAGTTLISVSAAHDAGVTQAMLNVDRVSTGYGVTHDPVRIYHHRFATLQVGDLVFTNVVLSVASGIPDGGSLLGADMLRHYRIWLPRVGSKMYVQHDVDIQE